MRIKKIRGHKKIWKAIEQWKNSNLQLDLQSLKVRERDYTKIYVHPYSSISMLNSECTQPKGETRKRILNALFEIYEHWEQQLNALNEPYYLKIWFYEPRFSKSQIVCAIGNAIEFYEKTFNSPENVQEFKPEHIGITTNRIENFNWEHKLDQEFMLSTDVGNPEDYENEKEYVEDKKWFNNRLKKKHHKKILKDKTEIYAFELGKVWIGEKLR